MRAPYRSVPGPNNTTLWFPLIRVRVGKKHGQITHFFEAMVDSGASDCMFPKDVGDAIGIDLKSGAKEERNGIGGKQDCWVHDIVLYVGSHALNIRAAFVDHLPLAGLLGRVGFFEHFKVTFDPTGNPPGLELERVNKA